jgi:ribulose-phosphate 3-epimerase
MSAIVPAILPASRLELENTLARVSRIPGVRDVQIDVVDGKFAAPASWPYVGDARSFLDMAAGGGLLPHMNQLRFEVDLMTYAPEETIGAWIDAGVSRVTLHAESTQHLARTIEEFRVRFGQDKNFIPDLLSLGLAINSETPVALIEPYLNKIEYVQFMGIARIGKQGQPFDERVLARVKAFHAKYPEMPIQVDGAVTELTAPQLLAAGASRLVVGHALLEARDITQMFQKLTKLTEEFGRYE